MNKITRVRLLDPAFAHPAAWVGAIGRGVPRDAARARYASGCLADAALSASIRTLG